MTKAADFLVEIGTEELPPKALRSLMDAFAGGLESAVDDARLGHGNVFAYASPRRLAVLIENLELAQADRKSTQKGPPVKVAFDDDGNPTPAAMAFAKKGGVEVDALPLHAVLPIPPRGARWQRRTSPWPRIPAHRRAVYPRGSVASTNAGSAPTRAWTRSRRPSFAA